MPGTGTGAWASTAPEFPVIAFLFGGGFDGGTSNSYDPIYFMDEDVVVVTVESRIGALGMCHNFKFHNSLLYSLA